MKMTSTAAYAAVEAKASNLDAPRSRVMILKITVVTVMRQS
jgi:hypothetical protein